MSSSIGKILLDSKKWVSPIKSQSPKPFKPQSPKPYSSPAKTLRCARNLMNDFKAEDDIAFPLSSRSVKKTKDKATTDVTRMVFLAAANKKQKKVESSAPDAYDFSIFMVLTIKNNVGNTLDKIASRKLAITKILTVLKGYSSETKARALEYTQYLLKTSTSHDECMTELGLVLFYLDRDGELPLTSSSLLMYRAEQIQEQFLLLEKEHLKLDSPEVIASGKSHYILRALVHMVFLDDGTYNEGGIIALNLLLKNPSCKITKFLRPEHCNHIFFVLKNITTSTKILRLLQTPFKVHKDLEHAVRLDLKIHPDTPLRHTDLQRAILMVLFYDLRQFNNPNCFAIGTLIYMSENGTYEFLSTLIHHLKKGTLRIQWGTSLPLRPLLDKRLTDSQSLGTDIPSDRALSLAVVGHIAHTIGVGKDTIEEAVRTTGWDRPVKEALNYMVTHGKVPAHMLFAHELFSAYKKSALIELMLSILEFNNINLDRSTTTFRASNEKYSAIKFIANKMLGRTLSGKKYNALFDQVCGILDRALYFEVYNLQDGKIETGVLSLPYQRKKIKGSFDELKQLNSLFTHSLRLYYTEGSDFILIDTISQLQAILISLVQDNLPKDMKELKRIQNALKKNINDYRFRRSIANYSSSQVQSFLDGEHYRDLTADFLETKDLLIFNQPGGSGPSCAEKTFGIKFKTTRISSLRDSIALIKELTSTVQKFGPTFGKQISSIMISNNRHVWTLTPADLKPISEAAFCHEGAHTYFDNHIFKPIERFWSRTLPFSTVFRIHQIVAKGDKTLEAKLNASFRDDMPARDFVTRLYAKFPKSAKNFLVEVLDNELSKVDPKEVNFKALVNMLKLKIEPFTFKLAVIARAHDPSPAFVIAKHIRMVLIDYKSPVMPSVLEIENTILRQEDMPITVYLGDLNYTDDDSEHSHHIKIVTRIDYSNPTGYNRLYKRYENQELCTSFHPYKDISLGFRQ